MSSGKRLRPALRQLEGVNAEKAGWGDVPVSRPLDPEIYPIDNDEAFVMELLRQQKILVSHGRAFNWIDDQHFRLVTLPSVEDMEEAIAGIAEFLAEYRDAVAKPSSVTASVDPSVLQNEQYVTERSAYSGYCCHAQRDSGRLRRLPGVRMG